MNPETWQHIVDGDKDAYSALYTAYFKKLYNYGYKFTQDVVLIEDSVQEIFLDLWNRRSKMAEVASINSYLFSSFRYTLIRKIKGAQKHVPEHEPDEPDFSAALALEVKEQDAEWQQRIQAALNTLTPRQREAIFLRFYEGLSYEEVARIMGISTKATYKVMARSLASLKERLAVPVATLLLVLRCMH